METLNNIGEIFLKQSIIASIIAIANEVDGRGFVADQTKYRHKELMRHSYKELETIRNNHVEVYNQFINR